jgi:hypothetical protein
MGPFARNDLSLACNGFRFHGFHSRVNGPGLLLRSLAVRLPRPFGFSAPLQESVSPKSCGFPASNPLRVPRTTHAAAPKECVAKRRACSRLAPRKPFSSASASKLSRAPQHFFVTGPFARNGLSLARNGSRFRGLHSGVNGPGLLLRSLAARSPRPFGFLAPLPESVSPNSGGFPASNPLRVHRTTHTTAISASTPLQELSLPRDRSVQRMSQPPGPSSKFARFSLAPPSPVYC